MEKNLAIVIQKAILSFSVSLKETRTLKNRLLGSTGFNKKTAKSEKQKYVHALKDISCTIHEGERVGIIGHNGAGKSTFLRLICGIYEETSGSIIRHKKIHPMIRKTFLTGGESSGWDSAKANYLLEKNTLDGFREYIRDITEFTQLGKFLKLPMKTYSEGMKARLMFAILTSTEHKCIAVDEGFGAGDKRFFERASERLDDFINSSGTVIMASHSERLLNQFCTRGIVFKGGIIVFDGNLKDAFNFYNGKNY